jgi:hypothetical protein
VPASRRGRLEWTSWTRLHAKELVWHAVAWVMVVQHAGEGLGAAQKGAALRDALIVEVGARPRLATPV